MTESSVFLQMTANASQSLYFFDSAQLKLIIIKNLSIYPCKKYHLGTEHIIS